MTAFTLWAEAIRTGPSEYLAIVTAVPRQASNAAAGLLVRRSVEASFRNAHAARDRLVDELRAELAAKGDSIWAIEVSSSPLGLASA